MAGDELRIIPRRPETQIIVEDFGEEGRTWTMQPTLWWKYTAPEQKTINTTIHYLTRGLNWNAEYTAILDQDESSLAVTAWVSVNNSSGKSYNESRLKLVAGDLNIAEQFRPAMARSVATDEIYRKEFTGKEFFEYHLYTLDGKTDLKNNQIKQIQLYPPFVMTVDKTYNYNHLKDPEKVRVCIEALNSKGNPLPGGRVRLYKSDGEAPGFIGEDRITHTPGDEKIILELGNAFDITADRRILSRNKPGRQSEQLKVEVELRNHKTDDIQVIVAEPVPHGRSYSLLGSNIEPAARDAERIDFIVPVNAGGSRKVSFEIMYTW
jgi:hypothetical protein